VTAPGTDAHEVKVNSPPYGSRARMRGLNSRSGLPGPKNDGQVRDIIEVLLGTAMRPGEVLALRPSDITDGPDGMVAHVTGTVVQR
jgi:integrase